MKRFLSGILAVIWPPKCPLCGDITRGDICAGCEKGLEYITDPCPHCGCPISECSCGKEKPDIYLTAPFEYEGKIRDCLHAFKFDGARQNSEWLSEQMKLAVLRAYADVDFDLCTCVPMRTAKEIKRGYNQSAVLCRKLSEKCGIPCDVGLLVKTRKTEDQHFLSEKQRKENLRDAFKLAENKNISGKTILLVDDIKTTGSTLEECAKALKKGGAAEIRCVCAAVTTKSTPNDQRRTP